MILCATDSNCVTMSNVWNRYSLSNYLAAWEKKKTLVSHWLTRVCRMETDGLEPTTSCLQSKRSPN
jgi:hypothetical protein